MTWTATEWTLLMGGLSTSIVSIIYTVQKSRCRIIDTPCGCHCERDLEDPEKVDPTKSIPPPPPNTPIDLTQLSHSFSHSLSPNVRESVHRLENRT